MGPDFTDQLDDLLQILREHGVSRFECADFSVEIGNSALVKEEKSSTPVGELIRTRPVTDRPARGVYDHPSLWPNGAAPEFHRAEVKKAP